MTQPPLNVPPVMPPPVPERPRRKRSFARHLFWIIPLASLPFVAAFLVFAWMWCSVTQSLNEFVASPFDRCLEALKIARGNAEVVDALGGPIKSEPPSTRADSNGFVLREEFKVPISGPKGKGTLVGRAVKEQGRWNLTLISVKIDGRRDPIVLLEREGAQP